MFFDKEKIFMITKNNDQNYIFVASNQNFITLQLKCLKFQVFPNFLPICKFTGFSTISGLAVALKKVKNQIKKCLTKHHQNLNF